MCTVGAGDRVMLNRTYDGRLPSSFYIIGFGLFAWGLAMVWVTFGALAPVHVAFTAATLLFLMIFGIPAVLTRISDFTARRRVINRRDGKVETYTGPVAPGTARIEMLLPIIGVAAGFTLIGADFLLVRLVL